MSWLTRFLHLSIPAVVDDEAKVITVPSFQIPLEPEILPDAPEAPIEGIIKVEVQPETKVATVKVALKKKVVKKAVKKPVKKAVKKRPKR